MRFLIISWSVHPMPPEAVPSLIDASIAWKRKYEGKIEIIFGFAGTKAGGGIANVDSHEELDKLMAEYPMLPFAEVEIYPLVDLEGMWQLRKEVAKARLKGS